VVGHSTELAEPEAFFTRLVVGVPVLAVRQPDGTVQAFRNVCRHRGGRVEMESSGSKRVFTCRYHGWTYEGNGKLRHIPFGEFFDVERECSGLVPIAIEERHGLLWARLSATEGIDVASHLGPELDEQLGALALGSWTQYRYERFVQPINWKFVAEGGMDVLHPKFLHPNTVGRLIRTNTHVWDSIGWHGRLSMARRTIEKLDSDTVDADELRSYVVSSYYIYPNMMLNVQPASYELWTVCPAATGADSCTVDIRVLVRPDMTSDEQIIVDKTWDVLMDAALNDDWPMEQAMQEQVRQAGVTEFVTGRNENPVQHFQRALARGLASR
jgi:phenylpropionate dioxygenase-like ring-hydroxylating dioxygenase large terminal subunit